MSDLIRRGNVFNVGDPLPLSLDGQQDVWVIEAQYSGGSLIRKYYLNETIFLDDMEFLKVRANTDWVKGWAVLIVPHWTEVEPAEGDTDA